MSSSKMTRQFKKKISENYEICLMTGAFVNISCMASVAFKSFPEDLKP